MNPIKSILGIFLCIVAVIIIFVVAIIILSYNFPDKRDYNCVSFISENQMLMVFHRAGGPLKDPYHLTRKGGKPCSTFVYQ